jgi:RNA polymerase sigma-70 factor (ECF subfamily)
MTVDTFVLSLPAADHLLIRQVAAGDQQAFGILYDQYSTAIYNYLVRLIHEPQTAEDLLQEVFMVLWQSAKKFREEARVKTWLLSIAHYQAVSWLRRHHPALPLEDSIDTATDELHLDDQVAQTWETNRVWGQLDQLSPKHRAVIELAFVHNLPYADIAKVLDCPIGTVKSRMSYALKQLNGLLKRTAV